MKVRRAIFWILVLLFIILPCWWVFHFPFCPELVCRVIPPDATLATRHIAPAERWLAFAGSPAVAKVAAELGADPAVIAETLDSSGLPAVVNFLGSRYVVTGLVPSVGVRSEKALVFGAWVGGYSQLLRWGLLDRQLGEFTVHRISGRRRVWFRPCHELKLGYNLSFTVHEGVLVGCLSSEPLGVLYFLPRLQRQVPLSSLAQEWREDTDSDDMPDAFKALVAVPCEAGDLDVLLRGGLTEVSSQRLAGRIELPPAADLGELGAWIPGKAAGEVLAGSGTPASILGQGPTIITAMPVSRVDSLMRLSSDKGVMRTWATLRDYVRANDDVYMFACGGEYYGRMMRMKVPALGLVVPLNADVDDEAAVRHLLDVLNADYGWGLISTPDARDSRIRVLDSVRSGSFKRLFGANERPAIAVCDGLMIAMSNVDVLRRILSEGNRGAGAWASRLAEYDATVYGWADLADSSDLMITALAGYTLASLMQSGNSVPQRHDTAQMKAIIKALGALDQFMFWLQPNDGSAVLRVELALTVAVSGL